MEINNSFLIGEKVILTVIDTENEKDINSIVSFRNDPKLGQFIGRNYPQTRLDVVKDVQIENKVFLGIQEKDSNNLIGFIVLRRINTINRTGKITIFIGVEDRISKGLGYQSMKLILDYAFNTLNLRKINADVFDFNTRGISFFKKLGFQEQGIMKKEYFINGKYCDDVLLCLFKDEWLMGSCK